jgi:hypothetical protein
METAALPDMKTIIFNSNGERIRVNFTFTGLIAASYAFTLWEAGSNNRVLYETGNNQNNDDDSFFLPLPVPVNNGRLIELRTEFIGLDAVSYKLYKIKTEILQGSNNLGSEEDSGEVTGKTQSSIIFIKLSSS